MNLRKQLGRSIRSIRLEIGMTQEELAVKAGLHSTYIGGVERGERNVSVDNIEKIAKGLSTAPGDLFPHTRKRLESIVTTHLEKLKTQLLDDLREI